MTWFKTAFEAIYLQLYSHRDREDALRAMAFLRERVGLDGVGRTLDLCCGAGRHLIAIRAAGLNAVGLDLSRALLGAAAQELARQEMPLSLAQGEMDRLPFAAASFDLIVNLFTSFGYFETDEENAAVVREAARVLRPGGRFVIDFLNAPRVRASLVPYTRETREDGLVIESRRAIEGRPPRVVKHVRVQGHGVEEEILESVRLFTREELESLLTSAGFGVTGAWGDFDGRDYNDSAPRCVLAGEKRKKI